MLRPIGGAAAPTAPPLNPPLSVNVNLYNNAVLLSNAKFMQNMTKKVTKS